MRNFYLSPHTLNLSLDCPRCFWFHIHRGEDFKRPSPPTSTLPNGMDALIKKYFDIYRNKQILPPELAAVTDGKLVEESMITQWRYWKTGLQFDDSDGSKLIGAFDECLIEHNRQYVPVDYKTRGFDLKDDSVSYYLLQMSCYNFLLHKNKYPVNNCAYLVFYIPRDVGENGAVRFSIEIKKVDTYPLEKVYGIFSEALHILSLPDAPVSSKACSFCHWASKVIRNEQTQLKLF